MKQDKDIMEIVNDTKERFRAALEGSSELIYILDFQGNVLDANSFMAEMFGYSREELLKMNIRQLLPADQVQRALDRMQLFLKSGNVEKKEQDFDILTKSGEIRHVEIQAAFLFKDGKAVAVQGIGRDRTERMRAEAFLKRAEEELRQSEKLAALGLLAGGVAHEINNPLTVILGYSQVALNELKEGSSLYEPMLAIEREAERCRKIVGELLLFSREQTKTFQKADLNKTVEDGLFLVETLNKGKIFRIIKDYGENIPPLSLNIGRIQQVVINLCSNAIDAMPGGGEIKVTTRLYGANALVSIRDSGTGMTNETKQHLFEPFFTTKEPGKGTGLGLSVSYEIIKQHKGTINVESEPEKGTTFTLSIPYE